MKGEKCIIYTTNTSSTTLTRKLLNNVIKLYYMTIQINQFGQLITNINCGT